MTQPDIGCNGCHNKKVTLLRAEIRLFYDGDLSYLCPACYEEIKEKVFSSVRIVDKGIDFAFPTIEFISKPTDEK